MCMKVSCFMLYSSLSIILACGLFVCANEFVKKVPARVQRKHAQQRDILIERCATLLDTLMDDGMSLMERCARLTRTWYGLLKSLATTDSSEVETAGLDALKGYVASLEEVAVLQQKFELALKVCEERRVLLDKACPS
jgi:hypothetical protein